jgi:hypothetical protein
MPLDTAVAIISVAAFKVGGIIDPNEDANEDLIREVINGVSVAFNTFCNRIFITKTETDLYIDGSGQKTLELPNMPVNTLTNLYYDDTLLTEGKDNDYIVYGKEGEGYVYRTSGVWADIRQIVKIGSLITGYTLALMPADVKLACMKQCDHEYRGGIQSSWGEKSRSFEGGSVTLEVGSLLESVEQILEKYVLLYG